MYVCINNTPFRGYTLNFTLYQIRTRKIKFSLSNTKPLTQIIAAKSFKAINGLNTAHARTYFRRKISKRKRKV